MASQEERTRDLVLAALGELWHDSPIVRDVTALCDECGNRFFGTESEALGRDWLLKRFEAYGLEDVHLEPFQYVGWKRGACSFQVLTPRVRDIPAISLVLAPSTPPGGIEAEVVFLGQGTREEFDRRAREIPGRLVAVQTGAPLGQVIHRTSKYGWAAEAGAVGFIFINETTGQLFPSGTVAAGYREGGRMPAIALTLEGGAYLLRQLEQGAVRARVTVQGNEIRPGSTSWNIVGDIRGTGESEEQIVVGAHWDGHDLADAALDDGLGVCTVLGVARSLTRLRGRLRRNIRIVGFGNEENWVAGSTNYVHQHQDELDRIALMANCDGIGRFGGSQVRVVYPERELVSYFRRVVKENNLPLKVTPPEWIPGSSDHWPFVMQGVPTISFIGTRTPAEVQLGRGIDHTQADTVDKLDELRARNAAMILAQVMIRMADEPGPIAPHFDRWEFYRILSEKGVVDELRAEGRWHPDSILGV
ncbi:MAG: M28 family peptidase [Chloroflexi bacterium]|nr:M28 family peptidase [Chloroflexota bacterium]